MALSTKATKVADGFKTQRTKAKIDLNTITNFGGNKADLDLVQLDDPSDVEDLEVDDDDETHSVNEDELFKYVEELGIKQHRPNYSETKEKKIKLVSADWPQEDDIKSEGKKKSKNKFKVQDEEISSTTPSLVSEDTPDQKTENDLKNLLVYISKGYSKRNHALIKPGKWLSQLDSKDSSLFNGSSQFSDFNKLEEFAENLLKHDAQISEQKNSSSDRSNDEWMKKMLTSGTLADRVAASASLIQTDPVHNIFILENLVNQMKKKKKEMATAIDACKNIFMDLLPNKRKLRTFAQMPFQTLGSLSSGNKDTQDRYIILWFFESRLKKVYEAFVDAVLSATFDTVLANKLKAMKVALDLLMYKPEQEQKLLSGIVNKLGDPERKVASNVAHLLSQLVKKHPNMKVIVASNVESLLYRPNIIQKAQYYAICFLNQMILNKKDEELSVKLITIYFSFFKASVKTKEVDSKLMSALLIGVIRAFPFAKGSDKMNLDDQISTIYKLVHTVDKFAVSLQCLTLLYQVCSARDDLTDRYYTALYSKMLDPDIKNSSKQSLFLNLLFKSMKSDPSDKRCKAFIKRLLQICFSQLPTFICSALMIVSEIVKQRPNVISLHQSGLATEEGSDEERFVDVDDSSDDEKVESKNQASASSSRPKDSWTHKPQKLDNYDYTTRNPLYCSADRAIETELVTLSRHYHPSVVVFSNSILHSEPINYKGDPMNDFSLRRFLDRFVFRNPKKSTKQEKQQHVLSSRSKAGTQAKSQVAVNSEEFYNMSAENVPTDQLFFHNYFHKLTESSKHKLGCKLNKAAPADGEAEDSEDSDVEDHDFDSYLSKYEKSLYSDMTDAYSEDFASGFVKDKKGKQKQKQAGDDDGSDSDGQLSDDDEPVEYDLKPSDFGLDEDDDISEGDGEGNEMDAFIDKNYDEDEDSDEDLPLNMDGEEEEDFFKAASDDEPGFDEENVQFSDDEFGSLDFSGKKKSDAKAKKGKTKTKSSESLFAAADEFADVLDRHEEDKRDFITSNAVVNRGDTSAKQLAWENKQERWLNNNDRRKKSFKGHNQMKAKKFHRKGAKRPRRQ